MSRLFPDVAADAPTKQQQCRWISLAYARGNFLSPRPLLVFLEFLIVLRVCLTARLPPTIILVDIRLGDAAEAAELSAFRANEDLIFFL